MAKKSKLKTPDWVLKGEEKPKEKKPEKTFKIKKFMYLISQTTNN